MIPSSLTEYLEENFDIVITGSRPVSGGSINRAYRLNTKNGIYFLKFNSSAPDDFFEREAEGLRLLKSAAKGLRIPDPITDGKPEETRPCFLLMEYVEEGSSGNSFEFGAALARLHQTTSAEFGLDADNYIGSLPQSNRRHSGWPEFFSEERILPQLQMAVNSGKINQKVLSQWERISAKLDVLIPQANPSLLHGDLWGGNYLFDSTGTAVLIDPAVYYGHPEMDLAFSRMFGGFSDDFYRGYESVSPLEPGFEDRVPLHNLYPLMVHVNLFGGHYVRQAESVLERFG